MTEVTLNGEKREGLVHVLYAYELNNLTSRAVYRHFSRGGGGGGGQIWGSTKEEGAKLI